MEPHGKFHWFEMIDDGKPKGLSLFIIFCLAPVATSLFISPSFEKLQSLHHSEIRMITSEATTAGPKNFHSRARLLLTDGDGLFALVRSIIYLGRRRVLERSVDFVGDDPELQLPLFPKGRLLSCTLIRESRYLRAI